MTPRIEFRCVDPKMRQRLQGIEGSLQGLSPGRRQLHRVKTRASRINGCAECLGTHGHDVRADGESEQHLTRARHHPDQCLDRPERRVAHGARKLLRRRVRTVNPRSESIFAAVEQACMQEGVSFEFEADEVELEAEEEDDDGTQVTE